MCTMQFLFFVAEQNPQPAVEAINVSTLIITCVTIAAVLGWIMLVILLTCVIIYRRQTKEQLRCDMYLDCSSFSMHVCL